MANISDFVSKLKGGGARANQFKVTMPFPGFAQVGGETEAMAFLCRATTLPASTIGEVIIPFRGRNIYVAGDREFETWDTTIINDTDFLIKMRLRDGQTVLTICLTMKDLQIQLIIKWMRLLII
jgi:hypothetical protein